MNQRFESIAIADRTTYSWMLDEGSFLRDLFTQSKPPSHFIRWLRADQVPIFWISGRPGSGKSTLMRWLHRDKRVEKHLGVWAGQGNELVICHFFITELGDSLQKSREGVLRSVLHQLLTAKQELAKIAYPTVVGSVQSSDLTDRLLTWEELKSALVRVLDHVHSQNCKVFIFLDGLDECRHSAGTGEQRGYMANTSEIDDGDEAKWVANCKDLVDFLVKELGGRSELKMCLSSRETSLFEQHLSQFPRLRVHEYTKGDIEAFSRKRLSYLGPEDRSSLVSIIVDNSNGVFLWVELVIRIIDQRYESCSDISAIKEALSELPTELRGENGLYMRMMKNIHRDDLLDSGRILLLAQASSQWNGLDAALASNALKVVKGDHLDIAQVENMGVKLRNPLDLNKMREDFRRRIKSRFHGLLECEEPAYKIEFVHKTVKDFFFDESNWNQIYRDHTRCLAFDTNLALLAGNIMMIKATGKGMIDETGRQFSSAYILAADAMHYAQLADTHSQDLPAYIALVDTLNQTMNTIANSITHCRPSHNPGTHLHWSHFEPSHKKSAYDRWTEEAKVDSTNVYYRFHTPLAFAALGNLVRYVEQKIGPEGCPSTVSKADELLRDILIFYLRPYSDVIPILEWLNGTALRYSTIGYRLGSPDLFSLLLRLGARPQRAWELFLMVGCCYFSEAFSVTRSGAVFAEGERGMDAFALYHQDQHRWVVILRLLLQCGLSPGSSIKIKAWYGPRKVLGLAMLLPRIPRRMRLDGGLGPFEPVLERLDRDRTAEELAEWDEIFLSRPELSQFCVQAMGSEMFKRSVKTHPATEPDDGV